MMATVVRLNVSFYVRSNWEDIEYGAFTGTKTAIRDINRDKWDIFRSIVSYLRPGML